MPLVRDAFCSYCGAPHAETKIYPRTCASCSTTLWANPIPVSVVLVPVVDDGRTGLLVVRRAIEPRKGLLALAGGFVEEHETWQQGGARELREEADVELDPATLTPFWFTSTEPRPNRVLLFSVAPPLARAALAAFTPNPEASERGLVFGPEGLDEIFAFPLHAEAARRFFAERGLSGGHGHALV
jgi:ADP-ribose pyrophosphatase YjhB (NUDIX family)